MKQVICIVYDKVSGIHTAPMTFTNENCAVRWFKTTIKENIEDYSLIKIADYEPVSGQIGTHKPIILN